MSINRRTSIGIITSSAAALISSVRPLSAQDRTVIQVGAGLDDGLTPLLYALRAGLFEQQGLDVRLQPFTNGGVLAAAVAAGSVDIGKSSMMVLISGHARGLPFRLVAGAAIHSQNDVADMLCVSKESSVTSLANVNGKTVAVSVLKSLEQFGTQSLIDRAGGNSSTVKFIELPFSNMLAALDQGRVDMATIGNPQLIAAIDSGRIRMLAEPYDGIASSFAIAGWFTTLQYVREHQSVVRRFADVIHRAAAYTNAHSDELVPMIADYSHIDSAVLRKMHPFGNATSLDTRQIQPLIDAAVRYNVIDSSFPARDLLA
jgi:ABC-type nitrate/sulfonate/bicarbonate transport system substrate-binding protein